MGRVADNWIRYLVDQREPQHSDPLSFFQALQENLRAIAKTDRVAEGMRLRAELSEYNLFDWANTYRALEFVGNISHEQLRSWRNTDGRCLGRSQTSE
jgi:hypothetical protein